VGRHVVGDQFGWDTALLQFPDREPGALEIRPCLAGIGVPYFSAGACLGYNSYRRAYAHGGQGAGIAMCEDYGVIIKKAGAERAHTGAGCSVFFGDFRRFPVKRAKQSFIFCRRKFFLRRDKSRGLFSHAVRGIEESQGRWPGRFYNARCAFQEAERFFPGRGVARFQFQRESPGGGAADKRRAPQDHVFYRFSRAGGVADSQISDFMGKKALV